MKARYPAITTVIGGEFISLCPPGAIEVAPPFDYYIRGYGEDACVDLLDAIARGDGFAQVSGLVWRNGTQIANPVQRHGRILPEHLSLYRHLDLSCYVQHTGGIFGNGQDTLLIGTSRGCPKRCGFCYWSNHEPSMLEAEPIVELVAFLRQRYGVRQYHIGELDFATNRKRVLAIARLWRERVPDCTWFALMSPVDAIRFTDEEWDAIAAGGCRKIELGTETGSPVMLRAIGKRHAPDDPVTISRKLLQRGIMPMHNFVFGLVGETDRDVRASLALIRRLQALDRQWVFFTFRFFQAAWGTPMGDDAIARTPDYPMTIADMMRYRPFYGGESGHAMKWLTARAERRVKRMVYHYLPLTTSKLVCSGPLHRALYGILLRLARWRRRVGWFGLCADRWLYQRCLARRLDNTYRQ